MDKQPVQVFDTAGRLVFENDDIREHGVNTIVVDLSNQVKGMYIVRVGEKAMKITIQ